MINYCDFRSAVNLFCVSAGLVHATSLLCEDVEAATAADDDGGDGGFDEADDADDADDFDAADSANNCRCCFW
ncbi:hypothetical protein DPMN_017383 [Dreissena polymorpha]|uniref:Secreted protein n=1 Tax=Dreissena polymorpha TaxID=45954 RepID=A0A9D4NGK0_DREPO|nr:hypothetical protein DPMN_017383 [Dreissena polymorpha]